MRGPARAALAVAAVAALLGPAAGAASAEGPCDLPVREDERVAQRMVRIIRCATDRWPVNGGAERAICIADRESGLDPKARSAGRTHLGIYQHSAEDWPDRYETWTARVWDLDPSALIGRTNVIVAIRMANDAGWGAWGVEDC